MRRLAVTLAVMLACHAAFASPAEALAVAVADSRTLAKEDAYRTRYLDMTQWHPKERMARVGVVNFWLNSLSRRRPVGRPVLLGADAQVLRIDLADYALDAKVWERLGVIENAEPYFHRPKEESYADPQTKAVSHRRGNFHATWLDPAAIKELSERTYSYVPIVRTDWFVWTTSQQAGRVKGKGVGYYDLLALGDKQQDFFDLIGADAKKAAQLQLVIAARVGRSGVAINNRGIARQQALAGSFWSTLDFKTSKDRQNALRLLRNETHPPTGDAQEQYGSLPNGLFAFFLVNAKGERQDTVPDDIAGDPKGVGLDTRIHPGRSCIGCHREGLRPVNDFVRGVFKGPAQLRSLDKAVFLELEQLYLNDLPSQLFRDNLAYRDALKVVNGLTPEENAEQFTAMLREYVEQDVTVEKLAFELGLTEARLKEVLAKHAQDSPTRKALADPLLVALASDPSVPLRREHADELIPVIMDMVEGRIP